MDGRRRQRCSGKGRRTGPVDWPLRSAPKELGRLFGPATSAWGWLGYLLLEGNVRLGILQELGQKEVFCLLATEDEGYTYNSKVNHISPIQEHFMILRTIESGVTEEQIAEALDINVATIRQKRDLLHGITQEVVTLLKGKRATAGAIRELKKVQPLKQIEIVEMMISVNNFSAAYVKCLLAATQPEHFVEADKPKAVTGMTADQIARIERELSDVSKDFRRREDSYGKAVINVVFVGAYLRKLLNSAGVVKFLSQRHPDVLSEFQKISDTTDLEATTA